MTYAQFVNTWNGRYVDFDGYYGAQCMDLVQEYAKELGLPRFYGNAKDVANQYPAGWVHVLSPIQGDVVVFAPNAANGYYGHIAIYDRPGYFFSQNYPTGSNSHIQYIPDRTISFIRPTTLQGGNMPTQAEYDKLKQDRDRYAEDWARLRLMQGGISNPDQGQRQFRLGLTWPEAARDLDRDLPVKPTGEVNKQKVIDYINQNLK